MAASMNSENTVKKIYQTVIDEVLTNIREAFLDEGYDEQLLQELKQMWEAKLNQSRALQAQTATDDSTTSSRANEQQSASSSHHHHHSSHHHHGNQSSSSGGSGSMRLPIAGPSSKDVAHHVMARNANSSSNQQPGSAASVSSSRSQTPSPGPVDIKPVIDSATRAAYQALPQFSQQHHQQDNRQQQKKQHHQMSGAQLDGHNGMDGGSSSEDEDDDLGAVGSAHDGDDDDDDDDKTNNDDPSEYEGKEDPDPLNSSDDLSEPGTPGSNSDLFDTENVIVCQYDKITRIKNKWKFHLKDGIMNINGKDYLFSKANGDAEW